MAEHPEFHPDLGGYVLGTLEADEVEAFEAHLATCEACQAEVADLAGLPGLLGQLAEPVSGPPAGLRERTLATIEMEARAPARAGEPPTRTTRGRTSAGVPRRWARLVAVAAAVVLVGVAVGVVRQVNHPSTAVAEVQLVSADGGPGSGDARIRQTAEGRQVELSVQGLAAVPAGSYYECWFVGEGDSLEKPNRVSVGTFKVRPDGKASVEMFSAADAARFPRMGVTLEPDDGNPARTGPKVLASK